MVVTFEFKRYMISICIFYIIIGKFSYCEDPNPIILVIINKV